MTATRLLRVAWARKGWIVVPVAMATGVAALLGWGLAGRVAYRASCLLRVTEGAHAEAVFACRSLDVLDRVIESREFEDVRRRCATAARLAEDVLVTVLDEGGLALQVDAPSAGEAERLVAGIAAEAGRSVKVLAERASAEDQARIRDLEEKRDQARANVVEPKGELAEIGIRHQFDVGPTGELVSRSRARLAEVQAKEAECRRDLAGVDAEIDALRAGGAAAGVAAPGERPAAEARLAALDREIALLRKDLTDEHPRLSRLLAERAAIERGPDAVPADGKTPAPAETAAEGLGAALRARQAARARVAAVLAAVEKERLGLTEFVRTEAASAEERAQRLGQRLDSAQAEVDRIEKLVEERKDEARRNRAADVALTAGDVEKARPLGGGPSVAWLALAGAALGLMVGGLAAALAEALDPAIRSVEDVARHLDLPVLATVPAPVRSEGGPRLGEAVAWLAVFLLTAALLIVFVYPGMGRLKAMFSRGASPGAERAVPE